MPDDLPFLLSTALDSPDGPLKLEWQCYSSFVLHKKQGRRNAAQKCAKIRAAIGHPVKAVAYNPAVGLCLIKLMPLKVCLEQQVYVVGVNVMLSTFRKSKCNELGEDCSTVRRGCNRQNGITGNTADLNIVCCHTMECLDCSPTQLLWRTIDYYGCKIGINHDGFARAFHLPRAAPAPLPPTSLARLPF